MSENKDKNKTVVSWDVSKTYDKRPADYCLTSTTKEGKPYLFTLVKPIEQGKQ